MSRGFGRRQRLILETLEKYPDGYYLASLTADNTTESKSYNRAAYRLQDAGKIKIIKYNMGMHHIHCRDADHIYPRNAAGHICRPEHEKLGGPRLVVLPPDADDEKLDRKQLESFFWEIRESIEC